MTDTSEKKRKLEKEVKDEEGEENVVSGGSTVKMEKGDDGECFALLEGKGRNQKRLVVSKFKGNGNLFYPLTRVESSGVESYD